MNAQYSDIYEGNEPYLFISYSHRDGQCLETVKRILVDNSIRYWYDNGLHSGDDWNMVIARRLKDAAACLLLLSPNSAGSEYVKNELNFAINHGIPIHTLLVRPFVMPLDIEMMTGRIQMVEMQGAYEEKLIKALPPEVFAGRETASSEKDELSHPLFEPVELIADRQGTRTYLGRHKLLSYKCAIAEDVLKDDEVADIGDRLKTASRILHPLFPRIVDYTLSGRRLTVFREHVGGDFLDNWLEGNQLTEEEIVAIITDVVRGLEDLYGMGLAVRDFPRGSMVITGDRKLRMTRIYNPYYGFVKFREETKRYYFEKELQEISILLASLCLGKEPYMPIRIIEEKRFTKRFLLKINTVIQKCAKENGRPVYGSFAELLGDLGTPACTGKDKSFLKARAKKLCEYDKAREERTNSFVATDRQPQPVVGYGSLEEKFGFGETVLLSEPSDEEKLDFSIMMCSTGQVLNFGKSEIIIGKDSRCDMVWSQPYVSRAHLKLRKNPDESYSVTDLGSTNGTYVIDVGLGEPDWVRVPSGEEKTVYKGAKIRVGSSEIQIL